MFGLGGKRSVRTFKSRVAEFWNWFPGQSQRFADAIQSKDGRGLVDEVGNFMENTLPGLSWAFGPGVDSGFSFTISGEGDVTKQLLAEYWRTQAPTIPNWTFFASRQPTQPSTLAELEIGIDEQHSIAASDLKLATHVDQTNEHIDIVAWHPFFADLPKDNRLQVLFLLLDEALGEFGTATWIGDIRVEPIHDTTNQCSIVELPQFIDHVHSYYKWEKLSPLESYSVYELNEHSRHPRGDTIAGSTRIPGMITEFIERKGRLRHNPLKDTGAEIAYIEIHGEVIPPGKEVETRSMIEDAVDNALSLHNAGETLGGAFGSQFSYIDLLLLDGNQSKEIVEKTIEKLQLRGRARLVPIL